MDELNNSVAELTLRSKTRPTNTEKSQELADNCRKTGNILFCQKKLLAAQKCYNSAIHAAPANSVGFCLALANRSACSFEQHYFESCSADLKLALKIGQELPECAPLVVKWKERFDRAQACCSILPPKPPTQQPMFGGSNPTVPDMSSAVKLEIDAAKGRKVVAKVDLPAGALIVRERSMAWHAVSPYSSQICSGCCDELAPNFWLPCSSCSRDTLRYCCEVCRDENWTKWHQFECSMATSFADVVTANDQLLMKLLLAQRLISTDTIENLMQADPDRIETAESVAQLGASDLDNYTSNMSSLMSLMTTQREGLRDLLDQPVFYDHSSVATEQFLKSSAWPEQYPIEERARLCRRLFNELVKKLDVNLFGMCVKIKDQEYPDAGCKASVTSCLFNHSCQPNMTSLINGNLHEWRTKVPIAAGDELCTMYTGAFGEQFYEDRQNFLRIRYGFKCVCDVCQCESARALEQHFLNIYKCEKCESAAAKVFSKSKTETWIQCLAEPCAMKQSFSEQQVWQLAGSTMQSLADKAITTPKKLNIKNYKQITKQVDEHLNECGQLWIQMHLECSRTMADLGQLTVAGAVAESILDKCKEKYGNFSGTLLSNFDEVFMQIFLNLPASKKKNYTEQAKQFTDGYIVSQLGQYGVDGTRTHITKMENINATNREAMLTLFEVILKRLDVVAAI